VLFLLLKGRPDAWLFLSVLFIPIWGIYVEWNDYFGPKIIQSIKSVRPPANKKALQSFFGKINFIRRFVPNFDKRIKSMSALLKKDIAFIWDDKVPKYFEDIKNVVSQVSISPDYSRYFMILSFSSQDTIAGVLLQKDVDDN
jgi:hypothetical protein